MDLFKSIDMGSGVHPYGPGPLQFDKRWDDDSFNFLEDKGARCELLLILSGCLSRIPKFSDQVNRQMQKSYDSQ